MLQKERLQFPLLSELLNFLANKDTLMINTNKLFISQKTTECLQVVLFCLAKN